MNFKIIEISGFKGAFIGMRNPMNSWDKSDSYFENGAINIGENDLKLAKKLIKGGAEHRKFLRMIHVQFDIDFPRYIWSEFDTYHFNVKNSCSTMHKLLSKTPITLDMFSYNEDDATILSFVVDRLENIRKEYLKTKDAKLIERAKQLLPEGFLQKRTVDTNYEELMNIYFQRRNHRLSEWRWFCKQLEGLPYFKMFLDMKEDTNDVENNS